MRRLIKTLKDWRSQTFEYSFERWVEIRAKGRGRFVLREAFVFTVLGVALCDVGYQLFDHGHAFEFGSYFFRFAFSGIWIGYSVWDNHEGKYRAQLKFLPQKSVQPH